LQIYATAVDAHLQAASSRALDGETPQRCAADDSSSCVSVASLADADSNATDDDGNGFFYDDEFSSLLSPSRGVAAAEEYAPAKDRSSITDETDSLLNVNGNQSVIDDSAFYTSQSDTGSHTGSSSSSSINNNNSSSYGNYNIWQFHDESDPYRSTEIIDDQSSRLFLSAGELLSPVVHPARSHVTMSTAYVRPCRSGSFYPVYRQTKRCSERSKEENFGKIPPRTPMDAARRENLIDGGCGTRAETSRCSSGAGGVSQRSVTTWGKLGSSKKRTDDYLSPTTSWQSRKMTSGGPPTNQSTRGADDTWLRDCAVSLQAKGRRRTLEVDAETSSGGKNTSEPASTMRPKPGLLLDRFSKLRETADTANCAPRSKHSSSRNAGTIHGGDNGQAIGRSADNHKNNDFTYVTCTGAKSWDPMLMLPDAYDRTSSSASCWNYEDVVRIANEHRTSGADDCDRNVVRPSADIRCCRKEAGDLRSESSLSLTPVEHRIATVTAAGSQDCQLGDSGCCSGKTSMAMPETASSIPSPASLVSAASSGQSSCSYELPPWRLPDVSFLDERMMRPLHSSSGSTNGSGSSIYDDDHMYYQSELLATSDDDGMCFDEQQDDNSNDSESDYIIGHFIVESSQSQHSSISTSASSPGIVDDELFFLAASRQVELRAMQMLHQLPQPQRGFTDLVADVRSVARSSSGFSGFLPEVERNSVASSWTTNRPSCSAPPPGEHPVRARRPNSLLDDGSFTMKCHRLVRPSDGNEKLLSAGVDRSREPRTVTFDESCLRASSAAGGSRACASPQSIESAFTAINPRRRIGSGESMLVTAPDGGNGEQLDVADSATSKRSRDSASTLQSAGKTEACGDQFARPSARFSGASDSGKIPVTCSGVIDGFVRKSSRNHVVIPQPAYVALPALCVICASWLPDFPPPSDRVPFPLSFVCLFFLESVSACQKVQRMRRSQWLFAQLEVAGLYSTLSLPPLSGPSPPLPLPSFSSLSPSPPFPLPCREAASLESAIRAEPGRKTFLVLIMG
jgi:hypothetical protein